MKQTSISLGSALCAWWHGESQSFTAMCGERVTRREVVQTAVGLALLLAVIGLADAVATWVAGGAL